MTPQAVMAAPSYRRMRGAVKRSPMLLNSLVHMVTSARYAAATFLFVFSISRSVTRTDLSGGTAGTAPLAPAIGMANTAVANQSLSLFIFLPSQPICTPNQHKRLPRVPNSQLESDPISLNGV